MRKDLERYFHDRTIESQDIESYRSQGYFRYGAILTAAGLEEMRRQAMAAWDLEDRVFDERHSWLENSLLPDVHHRSRLIRDYYFEGPLVDLAQQILGPNVKGATSQLTFKLRGNTKPFPWHQDNGYGELDPYNAISCLTALDDTDQENGCLWLIPGSNQAGQRIHEVRRREEGRSDSAERITATNESQAIPMPMRAGECLIFSCWTLHKSDGNLSDRDRRILFLRYADADAVEVYNHRAPRLGRLLRGTTQFEGVRRFEADL